MSETRVRETLVSKPRSVPSTSFGHSVLGISQTVDSDNRSPKVLRSRNRPHPHQNHPGVTESNHHYRQRCYYDVVRLTAWTNPLNTDHHPDFDPLKETRMLSAHNLSVQLYTVRDALAVDFHQTLARLAGFGYTQVEPFKLEVYAKALAAGLKKHRLSAPTAHVSLLQVDDLEEVFAAATSLGIGTVIDPHTDPARWHSADDVRQIATELNAVAERAAGHGLTVGYHNHHFELESMIDGRHALEVLADHLAPEVVLQVDTYWAAAAGADVPALLGRLGSRVVSIHIKDGDGSLDPTSQTGVGDGVLPVWDYIEAAQHIKVGVVELDDTSGDVFEAVERSFGYLTAGKAA